MVLNEKKRHVKGDAKGLCVATQAILFNNKDI